MGTWGFLLSVEREMHESTEYFVQTQQILSAFVSGLSSKNRYKTKKWNQGGHPMRFYFLSLRTSMYLSFTSEACMLLRDAVNKDVLSWRDIIIEKPLNSRLYDEILVQITSKANGKLRTLPLLNCFEITGYGLQTVMDKNP